MEYPELSSGIRGHGFGRASPNFRFPSFSQSMVQTSDIYAAVQLDPSAVQSENNPIHPEHRYKQVLLWRNG